ncbi:YWFCY domain-containing protein [Segetibacter koreensis]|uniref:YWFCY domain-containing protein n=1 Tax=Segetibacter koreensis TaxID=398037 RepID=UPI00039F207D|nr:YWFCY domain-containing protein [Segetibacter koreensis]
MSANTGENERGLRNVIEMTRMISIVILLLHFYYYCYQAFAERQWTTILTDRLLLNIKTAGLFNNFHISKIIALGFLFISLIGATGRKDEKLVFQPIIIRLCAGLLLYFFSCFIFKISLSNQTIAFAYIVTTATGFVMVLSNGTMLSRLLSVRLSRDIFNYANETFPQEERYLRNDYSINLPARFVFQKKAEEKLDKYYQSL